MIRTPLRPLARILKARENGENPNAIERENIRLRHEEMRDRARTRAEGPFVGSRHHVLLRLCRHWRAHGAFVRDRTIRAARCSVWQLDHRAAIRHC